MLGVVSEAQGFDLSCAGAALLGLVGALWLGCLTRETLRIRVPRRDVPLWHDSSMHGHHAGPDRLLSSLLPGRGLGHQTRLAGNSWVV